ncbi:PREDICTED: uncharacterized protein LOC109481814 isoform X2 [Branchiostoma belcheri]|uniref:Uncharacterized protein LOC109481814 isoform X2 n=1 Tax=Branchiostoma belcheri TaxID=7741 RepID=A0A6P5ADW3_BRABE|nr:PREDICTED: uncharacterized protein LOC109481814 isoform X2 [Branchiostoma belcheri]KAI8494160.1 hypothetical protein Bbelb_279200 [Branchiostoma belcheri]
MRTISVSGATLLLAVAVVVSSQGVAYGYNCKTPWNENCQTSRTADFGKRVPASQLSLREVLQAQPPISDVDTSSTYEDDLRNLLVQILRSGYHTRPRTSRRWTLLEE